MEQYFRVADFPSLHLGAHHSGQWRLEVLTSFIDHSIIIRRPDDTLGQNQSRWLRQTNRSNRMEVNQPFHRHSYSAVWVSGSIQEQIRL